MNVKKRPNENTGRPRQLRAIAEQEEKRKKEKVNYSDEWIVIKLLFNRNFSNCKFPFNRKDWYEALEYEKMTSMW